MKSYNPISLMWDWHRQNIIKRNLERYVAFNDLKDMRVLDVGCGRNKLYPFAFGVDHEQYDGVDLVCDLWQISELPRCFDVALMLQVIEHLDQPEKALDMVADKTVAYLVVDFPNCESRLWRLVWRLWRGLGMAKESEHRELKRVELLYLLSKRFEILDVCSYWFGMLICVVAQKNG